MATLSPAARISLAALFVASAGGGAWLCGEVGALRNEIRALQAEVAILKSAPAAPAPRAESVVVRSGTVSDELLALRGQVASLRREWEERKAGSPSPGAGRGSENVPLPPHVPRGFVESAGLPAAVLEGFRQQLGDLPLAGAHVKQSEGRFFFATEAKLADGRHIELALDGDGNVVRRALEFPVDELAPAVQQAVRSGFLDATDPVRVIELFEDGRTLYRATLKNPDRAIIRDFSADGRLLRLQEFRPQEQP